MALCGQWLVTPVVNRCTRCNMGVKSCHSDAMRLSPFLTCQEVTVPPLSPSGPAAVVRTMLEARFTAGPAALDGHPGMDALRGIFPVLKAAFPDITIECKQQIVEGNQVASHWILRGTHLGVLFGLAPSGKAVQFQNLSIATVADGRVTQYNSEAGWLACFRQLGAIPFNPDLPAR